MERMLLRTEAFEVGVVAEGEVQEDPVLTEKDY
jgi:hypothetical protein